MPMAIIPMTAGKVWVFTEALGAGPPLEPPELPPPPLVEVAAGEIDTGGGEVAGAVAGGVVLAPGMETAGRVDEGEAVPELDMPLKSQIGVPSLGLVVQMAP